MRHPSTALLSTLVALGCSSPQFEVGGEGGKDGFAGSGGSAWPDASVGGSSATGGVGGSSGAAGSSGASGTGGSSGCATAETCLPAVPPGGWTGPVTIAQGSTTALCQGGWTQDASLSAKQGLDGGAEACSCSCTGDPGCGSQITVTGSGVAGCGTPCDSSFFLGSTCQKLPTCSKYMKLSPLNVNKKCAGKKTEAIPAPSWQTEVTACRATGASCANGGVCAPAVLSPFDRFCIARVGDIATCPAGYPNRELAHKAFLDTRACDGACTCSGFITNKSEVKVYAGGGCGGAGTTNAAKLGGSCYMTTFASPPVDLSVKFFSSCSCKPESISMTGNLKGVQPVTYCCTT